MADEELPLDQLLDDRLRAALELEEKLKDNSIQVAGISKLRNRLASELKFLRGLSDGKKPLEKKYIETSNVTHFENLYNAIGRYKGATAVLHTFAILDRETNETLKHQVDLVAEGGNLWIKVISRNARRVALDWISGATRSIFDQAANYLEMSCRFPRNYIPPKTVFLFQAGVPDRMAARLRAMGVIVEGQELPFNSLANVPDDLLEALEEREDERKLPFDRSEIDENEQTPINLDVSTVFLLVSNLTHPGGTDHRFPSQLLEEQAAWERENPEREKVLKQIEGRRWIICRTAYDNVLDIVKTVAGPTEKKRVDELMEKVEVVDDQTSERVESLDNFVYTNLRSKVIFGSGEYYRAMTATASKHFVSSAYHQGVTLNVLLHSPRALSEQKEMPLE
ncbi:unnamed protein product, partial [Mesorhabditis spiculigera]